MIPDKKVTGEKVRDTLSFIEKLNGKEIIELENAIDEALTKYHQDLMSEVVEKLEGMKVGERPTWETGDPQWWDECSYGYNQALTEAQTIIKSK